MTVALVVMIMALVMVVEVEVVMVVNVMMSVMMVFLIAPPGRFLAVKERPVCLMRLVMNLIKPVNNQDILHYITITTYTS